VGSAIVVVGVERVGRVERRERGDWEEGGRGDLLLF